MADARRTRLGRGLSALLGELPPQALPADGQGAVCEVPVARCTPNPHQPRERFAPEAERDLADSVRDRGVLQPILVTPADDGGYLIVAGERRWRAARAAGLETIPALVTRAGAREMVELALIENLQREDLNAMEEARGYRALSEAFDLTQAEIAERVRKDRSTVANALRLLELPPEVQRLVEEGRLAMGHARALLGLERPGDRVRLGREAAGRGLSVRQVEARIRRLRAGQPAERGRAPREGSAEARYLEEELQRALGTRVRIVEKRGGAGRIEITYHSPEEFERLNSLLTARGR